jgi:hypothetical protein
VLFRPGKDLDILRDHLDFSFLLVFGVNIRPDGKLAGDENQGAFFDEIA